MKKHILLIVLIGILLPIYAQVATPPSIGDGTVGNPYQIANLENLYWITADTLNFDKHYIQTADIDASETNTWFIGDHDEDSLTVDEPMGWKPIGNHSENGFVGKFTGVYDGQSHVIDNLYINVLPKTVHLALTGLFGWAKNAELKNIGITNGTITGGSAVGLLVGSFYSGTITNCYSTGDISGGWPREHPFVDIGAIGGLIGYGGNIEDCWSNVNVTGYGSTGGLIGSGANGPVSNCFAIGNVTNIVDTLQIGSGGFVGYNFGFISINGCFWDIDTSGCSSSDGGTGLSTAEMKTKSTFTDAGWDFVGETTNGTENIWDIDEVTNEGYPFLSWQKHPINPLQPIGDGTEGNPYQIANLENLYWITADTLNFHSHYIQTADIDASETSTWFVGDHDEDSLTVDEPMGWKPIGGFSEVEALGIFSGSYDGQNHVIDHLFINEIHTSFMYSNCTVGLFGHTFNAVLQNIGLTNVDITGVDAGALIGLGGNDSIINCYSTGNIYGSWCAGGLIGEGGGNIDKCYSSVNVTGYNTTGGFIGYFYGGKISYSYSTGNVININEEQVGVGGFAGDNGGMISNCFSSSDVEGYYICGFSGINYATGDCENTFCYGNLTGDIEYGFSVQSDAPNCYWDVDATSVPEDSLTWTQATGLTTAEMKTLSTFTDAGWDFVGESTNGTEDIWDMDGVTNGGYPFLSWMSTGIMDPDLSGTIDNYKLEQNYPNPFNPTTTISFSIPSMQDVKLSVFNSNGQLVKELLNDKLSSGNHSVLFNAENLNSGIYFYTLQTEGNKLSNKMLLIK